MLGRQIEYSLLELLGPPAILPQSIGSQILRCYVAREMPYLFRVSRLRRLCVLSRGTQVIVHRHVHRLNCLYLLQRFEGPYFRNSKICRDQGLMARSVQSAIVLFGNFLRSFEWGFHRSCRPIFFYLSQGSPTLSLLSFDHAKWCTEPCPTREK